ncbi:Hemolysin activation/secretion protein [Ectothiorhodosinus mongolicus]|uniref:Hemolysin activation/secretion protein n=2 Tax=Ectothiorhodosinus mongolicus TaxID=233100 RepID=A0A1R3VMC3_9GAMM|nr:Hemolysin activation/secretion protein [Ectothiorhodosinus mongolicus]
MCRQKDKDGKNMRIERNVLAWAVKLVCLGAFAGVGAQAATVSGPDKAASSPIQASVRAGSADRDPLRIPRTVPQERLIIRTPSLDGERGLLAPESPIEARELLRRFNLDSLLFDGEAELSQDELRVVLFPWLGRDLSFLELQMAAAAMMGYLRDNGHEEAEVRISQAQFQAQRQASMAIANLTPAMIDVEPRIMVAEFAVDGVTVIPQDRVQAALAPFANRQLSLTEMEEAAETVAQELRDAGFALAQAFLPPQDISDGLVRIQVQEGVLDGASGTRGITITQADEARMREDTVQRFLSRDIEPDQPLNIDTLERNIRVTSDLPGVGGLSADLAPGTLPGTTRIIAEVEDEALVSGRIGADNFGSIYTGRERLNLGLSLNSPSGRGEQYYVDATFADNSKYANLGVHFPVGRAGWRLGAGFSALDADIDVLAGDPSLFVNPELSSSLRGGSLFTSYPILRSAAHNIYFSGAYDFRRYKRRSTELSVLDSDHDINLYSLTLSGDSLDRFRGQTRWAMTASIGDLDLSRSPTNEAFDADTAQTQGSFSKLNYSLARLQALPFMPGEDWLLNASVRGQYASTNLDPAEKFSLGGPNGVRAYPLSEGSGDHGVLASLELSKTVISRGESRLNLFVFYDWGQIQQFDTTWNGALGVDAPNRYDLSGYGAGASWNLGSRAQFRALAATKDGSNPNAGIDGTDNDGRKDNTRYWLFGSYSF